MSSTQGDPTFSFPSETDGSGDGNSGGLGSRGANYFFGFLITFVVLLLIFIGCGIGSRRRFLARRTTYLAGAYEPWGPLSKDGSHFETQPQLYERLISEPVVEDHWRHTMPVSATYRRGEPEANNQELIQGLYDHELPPHHDHNELEHGPLHALHTEPPIQQHPQRQGHPRTLGQRLRTWVPGLSEKPAVHETEEAIETEKVEPPQPEFLDVAVMIAMPSQHPPRSSESSFSFSGGSGSEGEHHHIRISGSSSDRHAPIQLYIGTVSLPLEWPSELIVLPQHPTPVPLTTPAMSVPA